MGGTSDFLLLLVFPTVYLLGGTPSSRHFPTIPVGKGHQSADALTNRCQSQH